MPSKGGSRNSQAPCRLMMLMETLLPPEANEPAQWDFLAMVRAYTFDLRDQVKVLIMKRL